MAILQNDNMIKPSFHNMVDCRREDDPLFSVGDYLADSDVEGFASQSDDIGDQMYERTTGAYCFGDAYDESDTDTWNSPHDSDFQSGPETLKYRCGLNNKTNYKDRWGKKDDEDIDKSEEDDDEDEGCCRVSCEDNDDVGSSEDRNGGNESRCERAGTDDEDEGYAADMGHYRSN